MLLPENPCSSLFTTGYKRLPEGGHQAFALGAFAFDLRLVVFGFLRGKAFWMWEVFGREDCWREIAERQK
jgi:hypothetical protein